LLPSFILTLIQHDIMRNLLLLALLLLTLAATTQASWFSSSDAADVASLKKDAGKTWLGVKKVSTSAKTNAKDMIQEDATKLKKKALDAKESAKRSGLDFKKKSTETAAKAGEEGKGLLAKFRIFQ
jgi:ribosomal protein L9